MDELNDTVQIKTIQTDKFKMQYACLGKGDKPLVWIPGLSIQSIMIMVDNMSMAFKPLEDDFTIYLFDRREDIPSEYSVEKIAKDTAIAIKKLGLKNVYLFGTSQGGMMAMLIAAWYPDMVYKLILNATISYVPKEGLSVLDNWIRMAEAKDGVGLYLNFGEKIYPPRIFAKFKRAFMAAGKRVTEEEFNRFIIMAKGIYGFDARSEIDKITCPVLVTGSDDDAVLGCEASYELARMMGSQLYMYKDYGHACCDIAPDYKAKMAEFFKD